MISSCKEHRTADADRVLFLFATSVKNHQPTIFYLFDYSFFTYDNSRSAGKKSAIHFVVCESFLVCKI